ncbi:MAG: hypothetical protein ABR865_14690 [Terracidiphilus sp.]|jgi:hypothetical protein
MKRIACFMTAVAMAASAATATAGPAPEPKPVTGQGCVEAGVEAKCLVVKDLKSGVLYNLLIKGMQPAVGTGIEFTGVPYDGMTVCMQGAPLTVTKWAPIGSLKCVPGSTQKP